MVTNAHLREGMDQLQQGRHALALEQFTLAGEATEPAERRGALAFAAQVCVALGRPYEAIAWAERLRAESDDGPDDEADLLEASAWVALGEGEEALACLAASLQVPESPYTTYPPALVSQLRCQAFGFVGDVDAALAEAFSVLLADWAVPEIWRALAILGASHAIDVREAVVRIPDEEMLTVFGWLLDAPPAGVDQIVEALWQRHPADPQILAMVTSLGNQLSLDRALEWSARLRSAGLQDDCAVLGIAATPARSPVARVRAASVAAATFDDERAVMLLEVAATAVPDAEVASTFDDVLQLAPDDLVDAFVVATATTAPRALLLADRLLQLGAPTPAIALVRHASELTTGQPAVMQAAVESALSAPVTARLVDELEARGHHDLASVVRPPEAAGTGACS